jgi:hypothetical protein
VSFQVGKDPDGGVVVHSLARPEQGMVIGVIIITETCLVPSCVLPRDRVSFAQSGPV